ncbi:MAG: hypothetical protein QF570_11320 [Myxococcota bacterium]|jgi:hypothetical protein|nr:hypothetical protein [Myxococcota bacterium]
MSAAERPNLKPLLVTPGGDEIHISELDLLRGGDSDSIRQLPERCPRRRAVPGEVVIAAGATKPCPACSSGM